MREREKGEGEREEVKGEGERSSVLQYINTP